MSDYLSLPFLIRASLMMRQLFAFLVQLLSLLSFMIIVSGSHEGDSGENIVILGGGFGMSPLVLTGGGGGGGGFGRGKKGGSGGGNIIILGGQSAGGQQFGGGFGQYPFYMGGPYNW